MKFALVGSNIGYTKSPVIHKAIYDYLGVKASYDVEDISSDALLANIDRLFADYDGLNITKPFKVQIAQYLNSDVYAVNTVLTKQRFAYNTDIDGFKEDFINFAGNVAGKKAVVFGTGGGAEIVALVLKSAGAEVYVCGRDIQKVTAMCSRIGVSAATVIDDAHIIINCTPLGWDGISTPLPDGTQFSNLEYAYDLNYPINLTPFLAVAEKYGGQTRNGIGMLIGQAIRADEIFLGIQIDYKLAYNAVLAALKG